MKVYTKTGDDGTTSLLSRQRVSKDHVRVHTYGTVDEANAAMGLARALLSDKAWASNILYSIQQELIALNADLATAGAVAGSSWRITADHVKRLEQTIDALEEQRVPQRHFIIPGATPASAALDLARTIVRRAERKLVRLSQSESVSKPVALYLNRLSDLLFVLARCVEQDELIAAATRGVMDALREQAANNGSMKLLSRAKQVLAAAEQKAQEIGVPMVIALVDDGGNLIAQHRMDGALLASITLALDKAYTAAALKMPTEQAAALVLPGQPLFGINTTHGGRLVVFGGGIPVLENGRVVAAIGVSGGSVEEDIVVAKAGLAAW